MASSFEVVVACRSMLSELIKMSLSCAFGYVGTTQKILEWATVVRWILLGAKSEMKSWKVHSAKYLENWKVIKSVGIWKLKLLGKCDMHKATCNIISSNLSFSHKENRCVILRYAKILSYNNLVFFNWYQLFIPYMLSTCIILMIKLPIFT